MSKKIEFTDDQIKYIIKQYNEGIPKTAIAKALNYLSTVSITRVLKQYNVHKQPNTYITTKDEHIFDIIDTADKAYWLGYIVGDGCIQNAHFLSLKCAYANRSHLIKFTKFIGMPESAIKESKGSYNNIISYIYVSSRHLIDTLFNKGIESRKRGHEHVPTGIPEEFIRDYLRGLIDSDGYICDPLKKYYHIGLTNSIENLTFMMNYFHNKFNIKLRRNIKAHGKTYHMYYAGLKTVYTIVSHLYYDDNITYSDKKYERVKQLINIYNEKQAAHK